MDGISEDATHRSRVEKYPKILIVCIEIFSESTSEFEFFVFDWWYDDREGLSRSLETREISEKFEANLVEPRHSSPFFIATERDPIKSIFRISSLLSECIGS